MKTFMLIIFALVAAARADYIPGSKADSVFYTGRAYTFRVIVETPDCKEMQPCMFLVYDGANVKGGPGPYIGKVGDTLTFTIFFAEKDYPTPRKLVLALTAPGKQEYDWVIRLEIGTATPVKPLKLKNPFTRKRFGYAFRVDGRMI